MYGGYQAYLYVQLPILQRDGLCDNIFGNNMPELASFQR